MQRLRSFRLCGTVATVVFAATIAAGTSSPFQGVSSDRLQSTAYSGASFLKPLPLRPLPSQTVDRASPDLMVTRLRPNLLDRESPHSCDQGHHADMNMCLNTPGRGCMWARLVTRDTSHAESGHEYCLPCTLDDEPLPCWTLGAWVNGEQVSHCEMSCPHQENVLQSGYACSDTSGVVSLNTCFDKGVQSSSRCMFIGYEDEAKIPRSVCAPCHVAGSGDWGCPPSGSDGPHAGWKVTTCASQCSLPGPPMPGPNSPGVVETAVNKTQMVSPPNLPLVPEINPSAVEEANRQVRLKAGQPDKTYRAAILARSPKDWEAFQAELPEDVLFGQRADVATSL